MEGFEQVSLLATPAGQANVYLYDDLATADMLSVAGDGFDFTTGGHHIGGSGLGVAAHATAYSTGGGDTLHQQVTDYLFESVGDWTHV